MAKPKKQIVTGRKSRHPLSILMRRLGITSGDLAAACNVSVGLVRSWRCGRSVSQHHLPALAAALRITQKKARRLVGL